MALTENLTTALDRTKDLYEHIEKDLSEFAQGVTDFQIEVFIANGEGPIDRFPTHAYRHLLAQIRPLISEMRRVIIEKERVSRRLTKLHKETPEDWDLDSIELEYKIKDIDIDIKGKEATYKTYERLLTYIRETYGPFTNEDLQKQEAEYWRYRLSKQMFDSKHGAITGAGSGNLNSLRMAFHGSILPDTLHKLEPFSTEDQELIQNMSNKLLGDTNAQK